MKPDKQIPQRASRNIIFVSYFFGIEGMVMSEWAQDKLFVAESMFSKTFLITSFAGKNTLHFNVKIFRIPSLSWKDFCWECSEYSKNNAAKSWKLLAWYPIAATFGRVWDLAFRKISKNSSARWSWGFTALPVSLLLRICYPSAKLFATGGATGGHLLGLLTNLISKVPLYLEFQDPLMGSEMVRSDVNSRLISKLEGILVSKSTRTVFVTKEAAKSAINRHPKFSHKILNIYPGAFQFLEIQERQNSSKSQFIELLHLGTLYGSRNLDNFFIALDNLKSTGCKNANRVRVKNLGDIYLENKFKYMMRSDFEILPPRTRSLALLRATDADALMLIQHADSRSNETIPYKTFDYLNLGKLIFGVINNPELNELLDSNSHFLADATSVESIQATLKQFLEYFELNEEFSSQTSTKFKIETQFAKIFE